MIRRTLAFLILAPLAIAIVALAVANRQAVTISFDPLNAAHPAYVTQVPLFLLVFLLVIAGVLIGGIATWLKQGRWRRRARRLEARLHRAHGEIEALKRRVAADTDPGAAPRGADTDRRTAAPERREDAPLPQWPPPRALPPAA